MSHAFPTYSIGERRADAFIHVLGVGASIAGAIVLMAMAVGALPAVSVVSLAVYSAGLLAVFSFSAAYNLVSWPGPKAILRRFDHAAIYLKIAATYTPFAAVKMGGATGFGLLALVWSVAVFGIATKLHFPERLVKTSYVLYLAQGWAVLIALGPLAAAVSDRVLILLGIGGLLYTVGVAFHFWNRLRYHNAVWHGFVLTASGCHYAAVVNAIYG
ncbi:MAG: PAQR family membrane homeostasis protein TrhA [Hyphomicrobiales bacterium]